MPRHFRKKSGSGYYHIFSRGINRQAIFHDDLDRRKFLKTIKTVKDDSDFTLIAWCLMTNHVHLLIGTKEDSISTIIKRINCSYAAYYNKRNQRTGALFQDRFGSEPIESEEYFINVARYIMQNPSKAGIAPVDDYYWSSYREYIGRPYITDCSVLVAMMNGMDNFVQYMKQRTDDVFLDCPPFATQQEINEIIITDLNSSDCRNFFLESYEKQKELISKWSGRGISIKQIADALNTQTHKLYYIRQK